MPPETPFNNKEDEPQPEPYITPEQLVDQLYGPPATSGQKKLEDFIKKAVPAPEKPKSTQELPPSLKEQYESQKNILEALNITKTLESGEMGIEGIDGKEYPVPSEEEIAELMEQNRELIEAKQEQGFKELLLVPFGMKLDDLIEKYKQTIQTHHKQGKLLAAKKDQNDPGEQLVPLELDETQPLWKWDGYNNADTEGKLVYQPKEFSENHQGRTKQQLINEQGGWQILLIEDMPNIPRENKGKTIKGRKQIEANDTPNNYLKKLNSAEKGSPYEAEEGMTPEANLMYAITNLEETGQVIDDWQGNGSVSYQTGAYFPSSGFVPYAYWSRGGRRAYLRGSDPGVHYGDCGARSAVKIYKKP